jgi:hypothetical protein
LNIISAFPERFHLDFFLLLTKDFLAATTLPSNLTLKGTHSPMMRWMQSEQENILFAFFSPCKRGGEVKEIICLVLGAGGGGRGEETWEKLKAREPDLIDVLLDTLAGGEMLFHDLYCDGSCLRGSAQLRATVNSWCRDMH